MTDPFESSKFSIAWAKDHIAELDREVDVFLNDDDACAYVTEPDPQSTYNLLKFKLCKPIPRPIRGHASDAAINLRNALDQAIYSVCTLKALPTHNRYFPIGNTVREFKNALKGRCGDLPQEIFNLIRRAKPYKRGNQSLWALNKLSGTNKHGILRPVLPGNRLIEASGFGRGIQILCEPDWDSDKDEMVLVRIPADNLTNTKFNMNYKAAFFIAFNEIEFIDGKEIVPILNKFVDMVEGIVMTVEDEARTLGLC